MIDGKKLPKLFEPVYGGLAKDFPYEQMFKDIPELKDASNRETENKRKAQFLHDLHNNEPLGVKTEDRFYTRDTAKNRIRIYTPAEGEGPYPIVIFYHGGGWSWLTIESYDYECADIAKRAGCIVVSVEYRFAPEHKFPVGVEDAFAALEWVESHAQSFNGNSQKIALAGDSAGGNFSAALSLMYWKRHNKRLVAQVLIYPCVNLDADLSVGSCARYGKGYFIDIDPHADIGRSIGYLEKPEDRFDYRASPLLVDDISGSPATLIVCGGCDVFLDDSLRYARRLKDAGVKVIFHLSEGMPHAFIQLINKEAKAAMDEITRFLNAAFSA
jgi:acetyl esterase